MTRMMPRVMAASAMFEIEPKSADPTPPAAQRMATGSSEMPMTAIIEATAANEVPCTIGSFAPIQGTPRVCSRVARPDTSSVAASRYDRSAKGSFSVLPTMNGTATTPAYMLITCCRPYRTIGPVRQERHALLSAEILSAGHFRSPALARVEGQSRGGCVVVVDGALDEPVGPVIGVEYLVRVLQPVWVQVNHEVV